MTSAVTLLLAAVVVVVTQVSHVTLADLLMPGVRRVPHTRSVGGRDRVVAIFFPDDESPRPAVAGHPSLRPDDLVPLIEEEEEQPRLSPIDINEMPLYDLLRLNSLTNISDFANFFSLDLPTENKDTTANAGPSVDVGVHNRFGGLPLATEETVEMAEMANCKPELTTVALDLPEEPNTIFFPTCVRIEQCGGCCYGPLLTCRPTVTKVVRLKVLKTTSSSSSSSTRPELGSERSRGRRRRRRRQSRPTFYEVQVEKHTACGCGCRVQSTDCNLEVHNYLEGECACVCKNKDEKAKCEEQNTTKYWDNASCNCFCRKPLDCSTGQFFSHESCKCESVMGRSGLRRPAVAAAVEDTFLLPADLPVRRITPFPSRRRKPVRVPIF